jgi:hypothetical protein
MDQVGLLDPRIPQGQLKGAEFFFVSAHPFGEE